MVALQATGRVAAQLISCIICLPPLAIQIQQRHSACSILILSTIILNFMQAINAAIWNSDEANLWWDGRIFCDIQIRLLIGLELSIVGAVACIFRELSLVFHDSPRIQTQAQSRWTRFVEFTLCIGFPLVRTVAVYLVQPDRYLIVQQRGCVWTFDASWPGVILTYAWQLFSSLLALVYAALTAFRMYRHRQRTTGILGPTENQQTTTRMIRLYSFAIILLLTAVPVQIYACYISLPRYLYPFSWSGVHPPNWSERIFKLQSASFTTLSTSPFLSIFYSCAIAILVALAPDSMNTYKTWLRALKNWTRSTMDKALMILRSNKNAGAQHQGADHGQLVDQYELPAISENQLHHEAI